MRRSVAILMLMLCLGAARADDRRDAEAAVDAFTQALADGDEAAALGLLAPDVVVYEAGHAEKSRDEYASVHLKADIAFLRKAKLEQIERSVHADGPVAWISTRVRMRGEREGKAFDTVVAETMILGRTTEGWRIRHIHWSSRPAGGG